MTTLAADLDFSIGGNSDGYVLQGWAEPEVSHRWTMGQESLVTLPVENPGADCILVINVTPCLHPPDLVAQTVMLALNGRLLATVQVAGLHVMSFRFPPGLDGAREVVLSLSHLSCGKARAPAQIRRGQPLGLMVHSVRVFRLDVVERTAVGHESLPGLPSGPSLRADVERRTGLPVQTLSERFESLGQGCQFGLVQRLCGAEPLGLLRFVDTVTSKLVDGLMTGFVGIDDVERLELELTADAQPRFRWRQKDFGLTYDTRLVAAESDPVLVRRRQAQRLGVLQRKFAEDLASAEKIFVLTRGDCLTRSEAFAVYCALRLHGPATLLWAVFGDPAETGRVDRLEPGFLRAQLGHVDEHAYGSLNAWLSLMANALSMRA